MNKREKILSASLKLLVNQGLHASPMSAIAKEAGTGMGTIYNYFPNKETLINALYLLIKEKEKALFEAFNGQQPIKTQFEEYYVRAVQFFIDNPLYFRFVEQFHASPIISDQTREKGLEAIQFVIELLEQGKQDRVIKKMATNELVQFVGGTILSYLRSHFQEHRKKPSLANQLQLVWDAIKE